MAEAPDPKSAETLPAPPSADAGAGDGRGGDSLEGSVLDGRYHVERLLGEGGVGRVYLARHRFIDKPVALKVLRSGIAGSREALDRFLTEARAASTIGDAHIVEVSDFGELSDGSRYLVMEFLDGVSLAEVVRGGPLPLPRLLWICRQIADGLSAAHRAGIVHRDLKPDNVMLVRRGAEPDFVKILDFGIAKVTAPEGAREPLTQAGAVFGTPHYMSPEQAAGTLVDERADVYALGVMMYEMLSGRVPFDAEVVASVLSQHLYKAPTPLTQASSRADISPELERLVMKCLEKDPPKRFASMAELERALNALIVAAEAPASEARAAQPVQQGTPSRLRKGLVAVVGVLSVATLAVGALRRTPSATSVPTLQVATEATLSGPLVIAPTRPLPSTVAEAPPPASAPPAVEPAVSAPSGATLAAPAPPPQARSSAIKARASTAPKRPAAPSISEHDDPWRKTVR